MPFHTLQTIDGFIFNTKDISIPQRQGQNRSIKYDEFRAIILKRYFVCELNGKRVAFRISKGNVVGGKCGGHDCVLFVNNNTFSQILIDVYSEFIVDFCQNTRGYAGISSKTINYRTLSKIIIIFTSLIAFVSVYLPTASVVHNTIFIYYIVVLCAKCFCILVGILLYFLNKGIKERQKTCRMDNKEYPFYTILVPMFKESKETVLQMINGLNNLKYPKDKLDIKFVLEECDKNTHDIVNSIMETRNNDNNFSVLDAINIINVPAFPPQTKPKACNVASLFAFGEYIVIFDAEDIPAQNQLINALSLFKEDERRKLFCLQGNLCFYNYNKNILTSCFNIEYNIHFKVLLMAYSFFKIKLPLGGTSNHFNFKSLEKYCFWDSYNVTEDVEISSIIRQEENKITHLNSDTKEWCVEDLKSWIKQRTRWMKGYLLTYYLCIIRDFIEIKHFTFYKLKSVSMLDIIRHIFFTHIIVGSQVMVFLLSPFLLLSLFCGHLMMPLYTTFIIVSTMIYFLGIIWYLFLIKKEYHVINFLVIISCLMYPFYFILHAITSYIALVDLIRRPFYWAKTEHKC